MAREPLAAPGLVAEPRRPSVGPAKLEYLRRDVLLLAIPRRCFWRARPRAIGSRSGPPWRRLLRLRRGSPGSRDNVHPRPPGGRVFPAAVPGVGVPGRQSAGGVAIAERCVGGTVARRRPLRNGRGLCRGRGCAPPRSARPARLVRARVPACDSARGAPGGWAVADGASPGQRAPGRPWGRQLCPVSPALASDHPARSFPLAARVGQRGTSADGGAPGYLPGGPSLL